MFAEQKKDYYSVNADIAIEANQQQRNHEYGTRAHMIQSEYAQLGVSGQYDDSQGQDGYGVDPGYQQELMNQQNMQLHMLDETMNGPQAVRYDEVYYPRTDKRSISKFLHFSAIKLKSRICNEYELDCNVLRNYSQREISTLTKAMTTIA